jgi:hypothetical protein
MPQNADRPIKHRDLAALGSVLQLRLYSRGGCERCRSHADEFTDSRKHFPPMPERDADVFEVLIGQMAEYGNVNFILGKALRVLPETKLSKPVRNLLHKAPRGC